VLLERVEPIEQFQVRSRRGEHALGRCLLKVLEGEARRKRSLRAHDVALFLQPRLEALEQLLLALGGREGFALMLERKPQGGDVVEARARRQGGLSTKRCCKVASERAGRRIQARRRAHLLETMSHEMRCGIRPHVRLDDLLV